MRNPDRRVFKIVHDGGTVTQAVRAVVHYFRSFFRFLHSWYDLNTLLIAGLRVEFGGQGSKGEICGGIFAIFYGRYYINWNFVRCLNISLRLTPESRRGISRRVKGSGRRALTIYQ